MTAQGSKGARFAAAGKGELQGDGPFRYHGDAHEGHTFKSHPRRPNLRGVGVMEWRPWCDTWLPGREFCSTAQFVRRRSDGVEVWQCQGHDLAGDSPEPADLPPSLRGNPLAGKRLVEVFSGDPSRGGGGLATAWEEAGGEAVRYDILVDSRQNFMSDEKLWQREYASPAHLYHFAVPCTSFSIARSVGRTRDKEHPYGDESDPATRLANNIAILSIKRAVELMAAGAGVTFENPLFSYFWLLDEVGHLISLRGIRADYCGYGTPYQKPGGFLSSCSKFSGVGATCTHQRPHPERLEGTRTRQSSPYPRPLVLRMIEVYIAGLAETGALVSEQTRTAAAALDRFFSPTRRISKKTVGPEKDWKEVSMQRVGQLRAGSAVSVLPEAIDRSERELMAVAEPPQPRAAFGDFGDAPEEALKGLTSFGYERETLKRAQRLDVDSRDIICGLEAMGDYPSDLTEGLFRAVRNRLHYHGSRASKMANQVMAVLGDYKLVEGLLYQKQWDSDMQAFSLRLYLPEGGTRAFWYNGKR